MAEKIWRYLNKKLNKETVRRISTDQHIPPVIATILLNRGIGENDIPSFMGKSMKDIRNPQLMDGMDKAVERILLAVNNKEKIMIYGDYDVDGITSTTLMMEFLLSLGADVDYYIPDRICEGYGMNIKAVNKFIKNGIKLMITVDCGITSLGEVSFAKLLGMDVIVTDHHTCKERIPEDACAVLNPKIPESSYPFDGLAGVGVAFKLVLALAIALKMNTTQCFMKYIDIVTIGTIADVVPLVDENRVMVDRGLTVIRKSQRPAVQALLKVSGMAEKPITSSTIAFSIAPRLNAAGRLGNAAMGVKLLLSNDIDEATAIAEELDRTNVERRSTEQHIFDDATSLIAEDVNFTKKKVIVLAKKDWHQGVIGIVASRISDIYYKPCILVSISENGEGKGSGRSIPGFNLFDALSQCEEHLVGFGGHSAAAGLNVDKADIEAFAAKINKYADEHLTAEDMIPQLNIDCQLNENNLNLDSVKMLNSLEPFGMGNERPIFSIENAVVSTFAPVGNDNKHLRLRICKNGKHINCIGFGFGSMADKLYEGERISLAFQMDINRYQNNETLQLLIKDIKTDTVEG